MDLAIATAEALQNENFKAISVDTGHLSPVETVDFARAVIEACDTAGVSLKVVRVDVFATPFLIENDGFINAAIYKNVPIVVDSSLDDRVEIVRI